MRIRPAVLDDLASIVDITNWYITDSNATFDAGPVSIASRRRWFDQFNEAGRHRLLVATASGRVCGYAGSMPYRRHVAFREAVELTVYLNVQHTGAGFGSALYERLISELDDEPVHRMVAGIALPNDSSR